MMRRYYVDVQRLAVTYRPARAPALPGQMLEVAPLPRDGQVLVSFKLGRRVHGRSRSRGPQRPDRKLRL